MSAPPLTTPPQAWTELISACDDDEGYLGLTAAWGAFSAIAVAPGEIAPNTWLDFLLNSGTCKLQPKGAIETLLGGLLALHGEAIAAFREQVGPYPFDHQNHALRAWAQGFVGASALDSTWINDSACVRATAPLVVAAGKLEHLPVRMREAMSHVFLSQPVEFLREAYDVLASRRVIPFAASGSPH